MTGDNTAWPHRWGIRLLELGCACCGGRVRVLRFAIAYTRGKASNTCQGNLRCYCCGTRSLPCLVACSSAQSGNGLRLPLWRKAPCGVHRKAGIANECVPQCSSWAVCIL